MEFATEKGALEIDVSRVIVAGWTGRDVAAVQHHVEELAELGVPAPSATPLYYRAGAGTLTQARAIDALGAETSGEAEPFIIRANGATWIGLASDHTDRGLEAYSVAHSKQICPKIAAGELWALDSVADPDALELRSWAHEDGAWRLYQEGTLSAIRPLAELMAGAGLAEGDALLCGTLPAIGGVRPASAFRMELRDPATGRAIAHEYTINELPIVA